MTRDRTDEDHAVVHALDLIVTASQHIEYSAASAAFTAVALLARLRNAGEGALLPKMRLCRLKEVVIDLGAIAPTGHARRDLKDSIGCSGFNTPRRPDRLQADEAGRDSADQNGGQQR